MRAKKLRVAYCRSHLEGCTDSTRQKQWDRELAEYKAAHDAGIRPDGTTTHKTRFAVEQSEKSGMAYGAEMYVMPDLEGKTDKQGKAKYSYTSYKEYNEAVAQTTSEDTQTVLAAAKAIREGEG
jgi:hypothetical protein